LAKTAKIGKISLLPVSTRLLQSFLREKFIKDDLTALTIEIHSDYYVMASAMVAKQNNP
tara:strand:- start:96 stop:272 length:177 start_codon:yes stop_codon:yes gene_type:complete